MRLLPFLCLLVASVADLEADPQAPRLHADRVSAQGSLAYLREVMDRFHGRFPVYDDISSAGNHFHCYTKIPDGNAAVEISGSWAQQPRSGATALRAVFRNTTGDNFGGFYFQNGILPPGATAPQPNFGTEPDAGYDLMGADRLTFWARGDRGGEMVEFFMGGVGRNPFTGLPFNPCTPTFPGPCPFPDSTPVVKQLFTLTSGWKQYSLELAGKNLSYVLGGFGWVANAPNNPMGAVFYLDDIQYELSPARREQRLQEPRLLASYTTLPLQPDPFDDNPDDDIDFVLRNSAFTYDNALALLAFLSDRSPDSLRRARLIGDAFVYASQHDRSYDDGRLRSDYAAGDISLPPGWTPNGRAGTVPTPGFFDERTQRYYEVEQAAIDTGNNAWAMLALLALHRRTLEPSYRETARRLGEFVATFRNDTGLYQGFQGGLQDPESDTPTPRVYASTEHNIDLYAAFSALYEITGEEDWREAAQHARGFVEAMWDAGRGCFLTGTIDPEHRNTRAGQLPLDVQAWSVLALEGILDQHPLLFACPEREHAVFHHGFAGFDFNEDRDGVWFEGTGHMALAYGWVRRSQAGFYQRELRRAQGTDPFGDGRGLSAACHDGLSTGFNFKYFRRLHVGATAWNVFAQLRFNPFVARRPRGWIVNEAAVH